MNFLTHVRTSLVLGFFFTALSVAIGAFGAHGLKSLVTSAQLEIFETGVRYQFYHSIGLLILGFYSQLFHRPKLKIPLYSFLVGIFLFSFGCYLYVLTGTKFFAMLMPIGGLLFIVGWMSLALDVFKIKSV